MQEAGNKEMASQARNRRHRGGRRGVRNGRLIEGYEMINGDEIVNGDEMVNGDEIVNGDNDSATRSSKEPATPSRLRSTTARTVANE